jgi:hypothetical protein
MKKSTLLLAGLCTIALLHVKKEKAPTIEQTIEVSPPAVEEAKDSTSIQISTDGVDVNTKVTSTNISVGGDAKAKVEVKNKLVC